MNLESVQLVKCLVENKEGQTSFRLIEKSNFDLWQFLVTTKHQIKIQKSSLCLWLNQEEFDAKKDIYKRAGDVNTANRILLMMFDNYGNFNNICRYVPDSDTQDVKEILIKHLPERIRQHNQFSIDVEKGHLVTTGPLVQLNLVNKAEAV